MKRLSAFHDEATITTACVSYGLSDAESLVKARSFSRCAATLEELGSSTDSAATAFFVPGRIEVVGKHTDYAGGRSLLCAVERGFTFLAVPRKDSLIRLRSADGTSTADFKLDPEVHPEMGTWAGYPQTVARRVARNFPSARTGADIAFNSDLPRAAGMSSSSAMVVAMFLVLSELNHLTATPEYKTNLLTAEDLCGYLGTIENGQTFKNLPGDRGVGTFGGSEDHTAIVLAKPGHLVQYAYCPVRHEQTIPFPEDHVFAIASSGVVAEKTGAAMNAYNRASLLACAALAEMNRTVERPAPTLADALRQGGTTAQTSIRQALAKTSHPDFPARDLLDRFDQFYAESEEVVPAFAAAVQSRDWAAIASITDRSQLLSETQLKNQVPQTIYLTRTARDFGAAAASAFGAGFGGSVWAIVPAAKAAQFLADWTKIYAARYPEEVTRSSFFATRPGPAAFRIEYRG